MRKINWMGCLLGLSLMTSNAAASGLDVETWLTFDPAVGEFPESITAAPDGTLYASVSSDIVQIDPDGTTSTFATLSIAAFALGVKVGPDGCVYTASTSLDPAVQGAYVWRACAPGQIEPFAELDHAGGPNDLAFLPDGSLLVTDPQLGLVYRVSPAGQSEVWLDDDLLLGDPADPALVFAPLGVNGIAVGHLGHCVYLGNLDFGRIVRVPVSTSGAAGAPSVMAEDPLLRGADGIALDVFGNLYVTVNPQDALALVTPWGHVLSLYTGTPLDGPSSVTFGAALGDRRTLYVTSGAFSRAFGFQPGEPSPAVQRTQVLFPGLPLQ